MDEPKFLSREAILYIHRQAIEFVSDDLSTPYDHTEWVRDDVLLESALFAPQASFAGDFLFRSLGAMAGAYWHSFTTNHPFMDGNKRVAAMACSVFLRLNGFRLTMSEAKIEEYTLGMAKGEITRDEAIEFTESHIEPIEVPEA